MSFYITLPSNSSLELFPSNSLSDYTTQLKLPLKFDVPYEVGLAEISYYQGWTYDLGTIRFDSMTTLLPSVQFPIYHVDGDPINILIDRMNKKLHNLIYLDQRFNMYKDFKYFIEQKKSEGTLPEIKLLDNMIYCNTPDKTMFIVDDQFKDVFGLEHNYFDNGVISPYLDSYKRGLFVVNTLYVYSDIIKYQYIGDTLAPLLRTVQVPNTQFTANTITYDNPHYVPLNNSNINSINISIKNDSGANIRFFRNAHKTIVKLHFRPMRYGF